MKHLLFLLFSLPLVCVAQKREEFFNHDFKPAKFGAYYYVVTEKKDSGWYREAYFLSQKTMAMQGLYKDEAAAIQNGVFTWYHTTRFPKLTGTYINGKREGLWLGYNEEGILTDSLNYKADNRIGVSMRWHKNGMTADSLNFDGAGNGVQVSWHDNGKVASAGYWAQDTMKKGRWKYFRYNGQALATEEYVDGKTTLCTCWDDNGVALDTALCREKRAVPAGGINGYRRFLETNLQPFVERRASSNAWKPGQYTVMIRFVVETDGSLSEFTPLTAFGNGAEDEIIAIFKRMPRWTPGQQFGRVVRSYHTQPVTFMIQSQ